jgi:O-methyltransferase
MTADFIEAPEQRWKLLRRVLPKRLQPVLRGLRKRITRPRDLGEPYRSVFAFTQVALERQANLLRLAGEIEATGIPGAVVECGVLDGGTAALMALGTQASGRPIHLFDSWEGLPDTTVKDGTAAAVWSKNVVGSPRRVATVMKALNIAPNRLRFHPGWFSDTFPKAEISQIALLHIDADFYDSVRISLERWFPALVPGAYVQLDDYQAFIGCRRAVDEFLILHPELVLKSSGNYAKAYYFQVPRR